MIITWLVVYNLPLKETTEYKKDVTITDVGIAEAVEKIYDSVVVVSAYDNNKQVSSGTGFVFNVENKKAYILTNEHVVSSHDTIKVTLTNDKTIEAKVEGTDVTEDIAVLSISEKEIIQIAQIGKVENIRVGDTVFAVGAPLDSVYSWTVTRGIVSGKDRLVEVSLTNSKTADYVMKVIQTDAAINSGNSGGPLCNANGEVIGITSLKLVSSGVEGMGFAIPIDKAVETANSILKGEIKDQPYLGIVMLNVTDASYYKTYYDIIKESNVTSGVFLTEVEKNKAAFKAGIKAHDIIVKINDESIKSISFFKYSLYQYKVGDKIDITVIRDGKEKVITVTIGSAKELS